MEADPRLPAALRAPETAQVTSKTGNAPSAAVTPAALAPNQLYRPATASAVGFQTTAELTPAEGLVGQQRAIDALKFGTHIRKPGFNLFVIGTAGNRMQQAVESVLESTRWDRPPSTDWVYVNNFADARRPIAIQIPPSRFLPNYTNKRRF